ncbi:MAG TPA: serine/threonine-protein kinase [bacterium]|nr:serine/threonine-protein kinase [bacterium]
MSRRDSIVFGRYEVIGEIGRGSMGVVYKARDPAIGRMVAVKSIPETFGLQTGKREEFIKRLRQEAMTAGRLQHPNIVTIFDVGDTELGPFIAMEYLDGVTLRDVITAGKKVSMGQLIEIIAQVADGLDHAHQKAIIHRDIKPANLMIVADNRVKIMDLGIARIPMSELTKDGKLVGSPSYMSPEQLSGKQIDGRSDLFSLGVCIYQLMTGKKPFPGENINEICYKIVHDEFPPPSAHDPGLGPEFDDFMRIALAKDPADRFQTGAEIVEALKVIAESTHTGTAPGREAMPEPSMDELKISARKDEYTDPTAATSSSQSSTIDDIFKELTLTARVMDLKNQRIGNETNWKWWVLAGGAALAIAGIIIFILTRSG